METVHLHGHANADGRLYLELPSSMRNSDVDVVVTLRIRPEAPALDRNGWPVGLKERFVGAYPDAPGEPEELELTDPRL